MPRSLEEILAHADELADAFEAYEPEPEDEGKASSLMALRLAAARRAEADRALLEAVADARQHSTPLAASQDHETQVLCPRLGRPSGRLVAYGQRYARA